jgi:hypothetical protein
LRSVHHVHSLYVQNQNRSSTGLMSLRNLQITSSPNIPSKYKTSQITTVIPTEHSSKKFTMTVILWR